MDRRALLRAICQRPDDDAPRLVYADWLEAHGDSARAEFIRIQLALASTDPWDPRAATARERQWALLREHRERWEDELPELPDGVAWGEYRRGFIEEVRASDARPLRTQAEAILQAIPLRGLMLVNWPAGQSLQGSPLLDAIQELRLLRNFFEGELRGIDDRAFAEILAWPALERLTHLGIQGLDLSGAGTAPLQRELPALAAFSWHPERSVLSDQGLIERIASAPWLRGLRALSLAALALAGAPLRLLLGATGRLQHLTLRQARLGNEDAASLARSGAIGELQSLDLSNNELGAAGVHALISALPEEALLNLDENPLGDAGLAALASAPQLRWTRSFRTRGASIGDEGVAALAASPHACNLQTLYLPNQQVTSRGLAALLGSPHLTSLTLINVERNPIDALPGGTLPALEGLYVSHSRLTDDGLEAFCAGARLPRLQRLSLEGNALGPQAARRLIEADGLPALSWLSLSSTRIGDEGLALLLSGQGLPSLRSLVLRDCGLTEDGLAANLQAPRLSTLAELSLRPDRQALASEALGRFAEVAWARGCSVDGYRPRHFEPWPEVALDPGGLPATPADRLALARFLQTLWFVEYGDSAWLKVARVEELREHANRPRERRVLASHASGLWPGDEEVQRSVLELFLSSWMIGTLPESMSGWNQDCEQLEPLSRERALREIARIVEVSEAGSDEVTGIRPRFAPASVPPDAELARARVTFQELGRWFELLFDPSEAVFFLGRGPAVLGLDQQLAAMFWLE